jgi:hypothetical protein
MNNFERFNYLIDVEHTVDQKAIFCVPHSLEPKRILKCLVKIRLNFSEKCHGCGCGYEHEVLNQAYSQLFSIGLIAK